MPKGDPRALLEAARAAILERHPYLALAYGHVRFVEAKPGEGLTTLACDKAWRVYYWPEFVARITGPELVAVLEHEVTGHLLGDHFTRAKAWVDKGGNGELHYLGSELEINSHLEDRLPEGGLLPSKLGLPPYLSAEAYAKRLAEKGQNQAGEAGAPQAGDQAGNGAGEGAEAGDGDGDQAGNGAGAGAGNGTGDGDGEGAGAGEGAGEAGAGKGKGAGDGGGGGDGAGDGEGAGKGGGGYGHGHCGSGAGQTPGAWELGDPDGDNPGVTELEARDLRRKVAEAVLAQGSGAGGALRELAQGILSRAKIPWTQLLRQGALGALAGGSRDERTYSRPNLRARQFAPVVLPGRASRRPVISLVIDTSGSVDDAQLAIMWAEAETILRISQAQAWVLAGDTESKPVLVRTLRGLVPSGGGGTDMGALIRAADALKPRPELIICLTDGGTEWGEPPRARVITAITTDLPGPDWPKAKRVQVEVER